MVALKPVEIERFVSSPPQNVNLILVYGPDTGLVSEHCQKLFLSVSDDNSDPFTNIKLDASEVTSDPNRLIDEALTIPLFGGRRCIWVKDNSPKNIFPAVEPLIKNPDFEALVIIESGDLKKTNPLRKKIEASTTAYAIPCYSDASKDLDHLIDEETQSMGLQISREARISLHAFLGADRMASRGEIRKLCLYAKDDSRIEHHHIDEIIGDASAFAIDELIDAAALGLTDKLDHGLERLKETGMDAGVIANNALRHFQFLHLARTNIDRGQTPDSVISKARPPIFWKRKSLVQRQLTIWNSSRLERALVRLDEAVKEARLNGPIIGRSVVSHTFLAIAQVAKHVSAKSHH
ncbi:DNA polymerase III subunit delta [Polycladidibacter stylochi]|uniref:DNA polymerase III subunit delta n=1 Tax=Polycladidibacter stylochi TaxID=1807766 RepID=UPI0008348AF7|nr:DNA polymerase III subunit delta [Pseudovibrio stylochi]